MRKAIAIFSLLLFCRCSFACAGSGGDKVQAQAVADTSAIVPGKPFMLGIEFTIQPGWHIYWKNPGDSGLPTQVKLDLPGGFVASEFMFPVPSRLQLPGDIVNYAYENQVMLMVRITPPKDLPVGKSVKLSGEASWLVCQDTCVPGKSNLSIELPVATGASPMNEDLFKQWQSKMPVQEQVSQDILMSSHNVSIVNGDGRIDIDIVWKAQLPADVQFFPGPMENTVEDVKITADGNKSKISFLLKGYKSAQSVTGLVLFTTPGGVQKAIDISTPVLDK